MNKITSRHIIFRLCEHLSMGIAVLLAIPLFESVRDGRGLSSFSWSIALPSIGAFVCSRWLSKKTTYSWRLDILPNIALWLLFLFALSLRAEIR
jgi:hypothetical protein